MSPQFIEFLYFFVPRIEISPELFRDGLLNPQFYLMFLIVLIGSLLYTAFWKLTTKRVVFSKKAMFLITILWVSIIDRIGGIYQSSIWYAQYGYPFKTLYEYDLGSIFNLTGFLLNFIFVLVLLLLCFRFWKVINKLSKHDLVNDKIQ